MIGSVCIFGFLGIYAWEDIRNQEISLKVIFLFGVLGLVYALGFRQDTIAGMVGSLLPGMMLLLMGKVTSQAVGYGDGLVVLLLGLYLTLGELLTLLGTAFALAGLWALFLIGKGRRDAAIPFLPFLLVGFLGGSLF